MSNLKSITKKSKTKKSKIEKRVIVEEIENGFLVVQSKEWQDDKGWHHEEKKFFSKDDPFIKTEKELADYF